MAYRHFGLAAALMLGLGLAFYPALRLSRRARTAVFWLLLIAVLLLPFTIEPKAKLLRLLAAVMAVMTGMRLYDRLRDAGCGFGTGWRAYARSLANPFVIVLRRVLCEREPPGKSDAIAAVFGLTAGVAAVGLLIVVFRINWRSHVFILEHCCKAVVFFLIIQFLLNGMAAGLRLAGLPATDFAGPFFLARTPAEFWRFYNRPVGQFFDQYVFKPLGGPRHPVLAALLTFIISGVIHEYLFDVPARRILGTQMAFFMMQGLAVIATLRVRPCGRAAVPAVILTFAFNLLTARVFLASMNAVVPFYANRQAR